MSHISGNPDAPTTEAGSIAVPLTLSLLAAVWAMVLICRFELASTQSRRDLVIFPLVCLVITACVHAFVVNLVRRLRDEDDSRTTKSFLYATWIPVAWVPSLVVMANSGSISVAVLLPLIAGLATAVILRTSADSELPEDSEGKLQTLFRAPTGASLPRTIFPELVASLLVQLGILAMVRKFVWIAGFLFALACGLLLWRFLPRSFARAGSHVRPAIANSIAALFFTAIAIVPYLKPGPGFDALDRLLRMERMKTVHASTHPSTKGAGYSGIILVLPPKPHEPMPPPPLDSSSSSVPLKPLVIKFDGAYWYFKEPDERPRPDAKVIKGDPLKEHIHSTNSLPLKMEAHQTVLPAMKLSCCSVLKVNLTNADTRFGAISMEVLLRSAAKESPAISLGTLPIPSSTLSDIPWDRPPVHETLSFQIPRTARTKQFNEITVRINPAEDRARAASEVSVESFVLVR